MQEAIRLLIDACAVLAGLMFRGFCGDDDGPKLWMGSAKGPFQLLCQEVDLAERGVRLKQRMEDQVQFGRSMAVLRVCIGIITTIVLSTKNALVGKTLG